ncbi:MAG: hypothetical protein ACHQDC_03245, partial [Acidimicrobiales bacterium]
MAAPATSPSDVDGLSPLAEIERITQVRANAIALDVNAPGGEESLRSLIREAIDQWADDVRRGRRPFDLPDPDRAARRAFENLARYGPLTALLVD